MEVFKTSGIVPDILDEVPEDTLKVSYKSGVILNVGSELTPTQVKDQPIIEYDADENSYYTLLLTDPDAPSTTNIEFREFRHWLVVNIPGNRIDEGEVKWAYVGSGPGQDSGIHRYVLLLFKQLNGKQEFDLPVVEFNSRDGRRKTNTRELMQKYNLKLIAGNLYLSQYDDYVPVIHSQWLGPPKF